MNNQDWLGQQLVTIKEWRQQYWASMVFALSTPITQKKLDRALSQSPESVKHDRTTTVVKWVFESHHFVLKRYNPRGPWHKIKRALRRSRARRCWLMSYEFQQSGLNVPAPALMYERRFGPIRLMAYFANRFIPGQELLTALPEMDAAQREKVAIAVKHSFKLMHKHRISHGDMKATNLLWFNDLLYFVDLDAARKHRSRVAWQRAHIRDRKRFLKNWREHPELLALFDSRDEEGAKEN
ncbi:MAG: hypothetical protein HKN50_11160 [Gammaproteobacteria bacterium]|nr:hypothetical protein [Gammaproteobacteria bacterium]